jgi:AbiJ N-terminal domain 4
MLFSERQGYTPVREALQRESMDDALRNGLWSALDVVCWKPAARIHPYTDRDVKNEVLFHRIWDGFFKEPTDTIPELVGAAVNTIRAFFFSAEWYRVYDFIEFVVNKNPDDLPESISQRRAITC